MLSPFDLTIQGIDTAALVSMILSSVLSGLFLAEMTRVGALSSWTARAAIVAFVSPCLFLQLGYDFGRLDHLNSGIFLITLVLLRRQAPPAIAAILVAFATLNHEAFVLLHLPTIVAAALWSDTVPARLMILTILPVSAGLFTVIMLWGGASGATVGYLEASALRIGYPEEAVASSTAVWRYSLADTVRQTFDYYKTTRGLGYTMFYLGVLAAAVASYVSGLDRFVTPGIRRCPGRERLLYLAPLSPALMFLVGLDGGRWSCACLLDLIAMLVYLSSSRRPPPGGGVQFPAWVYFIPLIGPVGVTSALPLIGELVRRM